MGNILWNTQIVTIRSCAILIIYWIICHGKKIEFINHVTPAPAPYISHQFCPIFHQKLTPIPKRPNIPSLSAPQVSVINLFAPMSIPCLPRSKPTQHRNQLTLFVREIRKKKTCHLKFGTGPRVRSGAWLIVYWHGALQSGNFRTRPSPIAPNDCGSQRSEQRASGVLLMVVAVGSKMIVAQFLKFNIGKFLANGSKEN